MKRLSTGVGMLASAASFYTCIGYGDVLDTSPSAGRTLVSEQPESGIDGPSAATMSFAGASNGSTVRYVDADGDDANDGETPKFPKKTIAAAVSSLAEIAQAQTCTVHVAPGLYPISAKIVITNAIHVVGDDSNPSHTIVSNSVDASYYHQDQRIFQLNHEAALVANLTMQNGQEYGDGGNLYIGSSGGMVSNCIIEAGYTRDNGKAGGAWLDGGLATHIVFRRNKTYSTSVNWEGYRAGVLQLNGIARVENCLFANNNQSKAVTLINLTGTSVMRSCSIVDTCLTETNDYCLTWSALRIAPGATVQNVVIAGVTNNVNGRQCLPTWTTANFRNGAFDGDVMGLPEETVAGTAEEFFTDYANGDYVPSRTGPLVNAGVDFAGMASVDLAGKDRKKGRHVDIGCYECQKLIGLALTIR